MKSYSNTFPFSIDYVDGDCFIMFNTWFASQLREYADYDEIMKDYHEMLMKETKGLVGAARTAQLDCALSSKLASINNTLRCKYHSYNAIWTKHDDLHKR